MLFLSVFVLTMQVSLASFTSCLVPDLYQTQSVAVVTLPNMIEFEIAGNPVMLIEDGNLYLTIRNAKRMMREAYSSVTTLCEIDYCPLFPFEDSVLTLSLPLDRKLRNDLKGRNTAKINLVSVNGTDIFCLETVFKL
jgi:hypothetical protein